MDGEKPSKDLDSIFFTGTIEIEGISYPFRIEERKDGNVLVIDLSENSIRPHTNEMLELDTLARRYLVGVLEGTFNPSESFLSIRRNDIKAPKESTWDRDGYISFEFYYNIYPRQVEIVDELYPRGC